MQLTGVDKLIMAAQMESNQPITAAMSMYFNRDSPPVQTPRNKSELELYQLLRRANLVDYFSTFLKYGGDDVGQLADANEEEFLEIIELIGMHQKPLHVRRLQKALAIWRADREDARAREGDRRPGFYYDTGYYVNHAAAVTAATNAAAAVPVSTVATAAHRGDTSVRSDRTRCSSSLLDEPIGLTSSASRSLFPVNFEDRAASADNTNNPQQYCTPHEVIRNAPKRPRLMDSIKPSDLTKGIQMYDSSVHSTPVRPPYPKGRGLKHSNNKPGDSQPTTPVGKRHPIQISPPDSAQSDNGDDEADEDSSSGVRNRGRARRKALPTKSK